VVISPTSPEGECDVRLEAELELRAEQGEAQRPDTEPGALSTHSTFPAAGNSTQAKTRGESKERS
jgi:hypothetical protein